MSEQLELGYTDPERARAVWRAVLAAIKDAVDVRGVKSVAADWDVGHSLVSNKLSENDRHKLRPVELMDLFIGDSTGNALGVLCEELGYERPIRRRELSPQEKLDKLNAVLDANPDLAAVVRRRAGL